MYLFLVSLIMHQAVVMFLNVLFLDIGIITAKVGLIHGTNNKYYFVASCLLTDFLQMWINMQVCPIFTVSPATAQVCKRQH